MTFDILWVIVQDALFSALAALGFALLFNVPPRLLPGCLLVGALGHATRALLMTLFAVPVEPATLGGAALVGFLSIYLGRRLNAPPMIFGILGAIPMVPGVFAYRAMLGFLNATSAASPDVAGDLLVQAVINAVKTGLILSALALGIAFPRLLLYRPRPVV